MPNNSRKRGIAYEVKIMNELKELGFKHLGFNKEFENMQPRFLCRFELKETYNKTLDSFYKSTKRNIEIAEERSVIVREGKDEDINIVMDLLDETAARKNFALRTSEYYETMFKLFKSDSKIFIASIHHFFYLNPAFTILSASEFFSLWLYCNNIWLLWASLWQW